MSTGYHFDPRYGNTVVFNDRGQVTTPTPHFVDSYAWRESLKDHCCEYSGTVTDLLKRGLKQIREKPNTRLCWWILSLRDEYYWFDGYPSGLPVYRFGYSELTIRPDETARQAKWRFKWLQFTSGSDAFGINLHTICPLTENDPEGLLPIVLKIIQNSQRAYDRLANGGCTIL